MGISTILFALAISIVAVSNLLPVHAGPVAAAAPTAVRSKRSAFYGFDGGLYGGGLYGGGLYGGGLFGGGGLLGGGAVYNHDYPSAYPGSYVGYYDNSPTKMAAQGDSYTNQNYKPYAVRSQAYGSYGSSSSRYKRSAFFGDGLYGGGLYGGGLYGGGLYGGYGGLLGGGAVYNHDYPSAYPGSYVGYYDSSPTKMAALGDSYTNQNYKPYAARLSSY